ncbi:MAG: thymidine phosphorylase [Parcubacteria group bacterium]|nr:thymidine phosphorylase [Parcubacteria group bacterium]
MSSQHFFLKAKALDIRTGHPWSVIINHKDADRHGLSPTHTLRLYWDHKNTGVEVDITNDLVSPGEVGLVKDILDNYEIKNNELLEFELEKRPESVKAIAKKLTGQKLSYKEIYSIMEDIADYRLTDIDIAFFIASGFIEKQFSDEEVFFMVKAMAETGVKMNFGKKVVDKHSIGGLPANCVTPLIVSIIASYGITIPKTSSRAITSAAGTADIFEVLAPVSLDQKAIAKVVKKTHGCIIWGGRLKMAPADERIIKTSYHVAIEPYTKMVVSIMAKKVAMGIKYLVLYMPIGPTAKITNMQRAEEIKRLFLYLGEKFGIKIRVVITNDNQPVGNGVGPALEAREVLQILEQKAHRPLLLEDRACKLAGELLEMVGKAKKGDGFQKAKRAIENGAALKKLQEIIIAQGGEQITSHGVPLAKIYKDICAEKNGVVKSIHNKNLVEICRLLGAPFEKTAGVYLYKKIDDKVEKGEPLFRAYAPSQSQLDLVASVLKDKLKVYEIR